MHKLVPYTTLVRPERSPDRLPRGFRRPDAGQPAGIEAARTVHELAVRAVRGIVRILVLAITDPVAELRARIVVENAAVARIPVFADVAGVAVVRDVGRAACRERVCQYV